MCRLKILVTFTSDYFFLNKNYIKQRREHTKIHDRVFLASSAYHQKTKFEDREIKKIEDREDLNQFI